MKRDTERYQHIYQYAHAIPERDFLRFPKGKIPNTSQGIHESGLPFIPERECSKPFREVGAQVFCETGSMTSEMITLTPLSSTCFSWHS